MANNIKSFYLGGIGSGIIAYSKEDFLQYISEEIDRIEKEGEYEHFDVEIDLNNGQSKNIEFT